MTSFLDALKDLKDTQRAIEAARTGGIFAALDVHQKMAERQQLRDLAAAAQESLEIQKKQAEQQANQLLQPPSTPPTSRPAFSPSQSCYLDGVLKPDERADVLISKLQTFISGIKRVLSKTATFGHTTVKQNKTVLDNWLNGFKSRKQAELSEREALREKWFKSDADKKRLDDLETVWYVAGPWGGEDTYKRMSSQRWAHAHFGFGPKEIAAQEVQEYVGSNYYEIDRQVNGSFSNCWLHAEALGVTDKLKSLAKEAKDLVESDGLCAEAGPIVPQAIVSQPKPATPVSKAASRKESEQSEQDVVDACLGAMCLVAAADGRLSTREIQYITSEMKKHGFAVETLGLREAIVETCRRLVRTGYADSTKKLVKQLLPFRGRPLANLVIELMEGVVGADGNTGKRETQILTFFKKNLLTAD